MTRFTSVIVLSLLLMGCGQANAQEPISNEPSQEILKQIESIELNAELSTQDKINELFKLMSEDSYNYGVENGEYHITPNTEVINKAIERLK